MRRLTDAAIACFVVLALGLAVSACQPQVLPIPPNALSPAEVEDVFIGKTALGIVKGRRAATYFAPDGTARLKVIGHEGTIVKFEGTYYTNEQGASCVNFPTLPILGKNRCNYIIPLGDGQYQQSYDEGATEQILDGDQLHRLE